MAEAICIHFPRGKRGRSTPQYRTYGTFSDSYGATVSRAQPACIFKQLIYALSFYLYKVISIFMRGG